MKLDTRMEHVLKNYKIRGGQVLKEDKVNRKKVGGKGRMELAWVGRHVSKDKGNELEK